MRQHRRASAGRAIQDGARLRLLAFATRGRARRPRRPRTGHTNGRRALLGVAILRLRQHGAGRAQVARLLRDAAGARLMARAAILGASGIRRKGADSAVRPLAAHIGIALLRLRQRLITRLAEQARLLRDGPRLLLRAAVAHARSVRARFGASTPRRPAAVGTIRAARLQVEARKRLRQWF